MEIGQDGGIANFMPDIQQAALDSNGFVLEIGPGTGTGSTLAIQDGLRTGKHIDPLHVSVDQRDYMVVKPHAPWWQMVIGDSRSNDTAVAVHGLAGERRAGLIFIDTDHIYEQMRDELLLWQQFADRDTTWLFHDTWMFSCFNEGMVRAIQEFADRNGWVYEDWRKEPHGLGRMRWSG